MPRSPAPASVASHGAWGGQGRAVTTDKTRTTRALEASLSARTRAQRAVPHGAIHHTPEFEGADYSLESMVRKFVKAPVLAYKPKKSGETDPEIAPILERGRRYIGEFASSDSSES